MLSVLLVIGLLAPIDASAVRVTAGGSVVLRGDPAFDPLSTELVATFITSGTGLQNPIVQQLPLPGFVFTLPMFVSEEKDNPGAGDIGTLMILTNTTNGPLMVIMQFYNLDGSLLFGPTSIVLATKETRILRLSEVLPLPLP
jgi:hypothetical protein